MQSAFPLAFDQCSLNHTMSVLLLGTRGLGATLNIEGHVVWHTHAIQPYNEQSVCLFLCIILITKTCTHTTTNIPQNKLMKNAQKVREESTYSTQVALAVTTFRVSARFFCVKVNQLSTCNM